MLTARVFIHSFSQTPWEDLGRNRLWPGNPGFSYFQAAIVSESTPPSPSVWCLMFELTPRVVLHQRECGCVNVCFCVCVWMSSIFILRGGCVCLTNRNNSIAKSMDSTPSLHQGSRYTCCPAHSWPQSRPPPPCFSFLFRLTQRLCNLRSGVAYFTVDSTI